MLRDIKDISDLAHSSDVCPSNNAWPSVPASLCSGADESLKNFVTGPVCPALSFAFKTSVRGYCGQ